MKRRISAAAALALGLAACSPEPTEPATRANDSAADPTMPATPIATPVPTTSAAPSATRSANILTLAGLGDLRIGQPVPANSKWAARGAQISETCRTVDSPDFPGVYAIVSDGAVRRITLGRDSRVQLAEGIGVGASEAQVRAAFAGLRATPHEYVDAPGKYLTAPNAARGDPALRFEIGQDGKVSLIHIGTMPVLGYVEGCA